MDIKALTFDVFGTVVDWRSSIIAEMEEFGVEKNFNMDWAEFADAWRAMYQPAMSQVRNGEIPWTNLDTLHRRSLDQLIARFDFPPLTEGELDWINRVWHRLNPWPDVVPGLQRLKRNYILGTLSNGNVALIVDMAKHAGLPWDVILGAEIAGHYKPQPEAYLNVMELLNLQPNQCLMVAAHNDDLMAAARCGMHTAFVPRPMEHGPNQSTDLEPAKGWDFTAESFIQLADMLEP